MKGIKLHKDSIDFLENVFEQYESAKLERDTVVNDPIVHLYAHSDTRAEDGELNGYADSLFFTAHIYDPVKMVKYDVGSSDSVDVFGDTGLWQVKVFKDGSTLMNFIGKHTFNRLTSLVVERA